MECNLNNNLSGCNCTYPGCPRKGICCECIEHHRSKGQLPACYFSPEAEATYDRSVEKYLEDKKSKI